MCNDRRFLIQNPGRLPDPGFFQSGILLFCGSIFFTVILRFSYCSGPLKSVSSSSKHYAFSWCSIGWSHILPQNPPHFSASAIKDTFCLPSYFLNSFFLIWFKQFCLNFLFRLSCCNSFAPAAIKCCCARSNQITSSWHSIYSFFIFMVNHL